MTEVIDWHRDGDEVTETPRTLTDDQDEDRATRNVRQQIREIDPDSIDEMTLPQLRVVVKRLTRIVRHCLRRGLL